MCSRPVIEQKFSREFLQDILKTYYKDEPLKLLQFQMERESSSPGVNYMSIIYRLRLQVENGAGEVVPMALLLKSLPTNPPMLKYMHELKAFEKEVVMFQKVFPELTKDVKYESLPKAIQAYSDAGNEDYILMEDLTASGYKMVDRVKGLDFEHAKLAVSEMAKFHALSFIKFRGDGEQILNRFPQLVDMFWVSPDQVTERNREFISGQLAGVKRVMEEEDRAQVNPRIEKQFGDVFARMHRLAGVPETFPSVINFGDCWTSNMMFKYDSEGAVISIKFLDFQLARVTSRCSDLAYLMYTSLPISILNDGRMNELLRMYHEAFNAFVTTNAPEVSLKYGEEELSWEYFSMEFEHYRSHGTTLALIYTPLMISSSDTIPNLDEMEGKDLVNMGSDTSSGFANVWKCKAVREKLVAVASGHLPMCFKPAQPPPLSSCTTFE